MARYFFHLKSPAGTVEDTDGIDLADMIAVRKEAREAAKELLIMAIERDELIDHRYFNVTDVNGKTVLKFALREAIAFE
jgi:hypothetical protein